MNARRISLAGVLLVSGLAVAAYQMAPPSPELPDDLPAMVQIPAGSFEFRPAGGFRRGTQVLDAPVEQVEMAAFEIMRHPVTEAAYSNCVADGGCDATVSTGAPDLPQAFVSYQDALAFAAWQSARTGQDWRLPTDAEWARAAAERFEDGALGNDVDTDDPAQRWLRAYQSNIEQRGDTDPVLHPIGHFAENSLGVGDLAGNLWEWTSTCFRSAELDAEGDVVERADDYCGVRVAEGRHRAFIIDFVRDARVGGCAAGLPPDFLGIRLVREL